MEIFENFLNSLRLIVGTFWRDFNGYWNILRIRLLILKMIYFNLTIDSRLDKLAEKHPQKDAFICDDIRWTFKDVHQFTNQIANFFLNQGFKAGDKVALFMPSKPEHAMIWFGLSKIGVITGLINENLRSDSLVHSITCIKPKALIFDPEFENAVIDVYQQIEAKTQLSYFCFGSFNGNKIKAINFSEKMKEEPGDRLNTQHKNNIYDPLCYMYTSGTTGYPKATIIRHSRLLSVSILCTTVLNLNDNDILYLSLPLYHLIGVGTCTVPLFYGGTVVIRKKFSASKFWEDCIKYECTIAPYIGEVTSYLLEQPLRTTDKAHNVRRMYGLGLRGAIWKQFVDRFQIKTLMEFYASTEGNAFIFNVDGKEGACGFLPVCSPKFIRKLFFRAAFVKVDVDTENVIRNSDGLCVDCGPGDSGMIVGKIVKGNPLTAFDGYTDKKETEKKVVRDVFDKEDQYFASGDIFFMDEFGYIYFRDRLGDTFRWKGENVSTNEVEDIIRDVLNIVDCIVYGVGIPNMDGKAGMVAITSTREELNLTDFYRELQRRLPKYAIPVFVRIISHSLEITGTMRFSKMALKREGYNLDTCSDQIYMLDVAQQTYVRFDSNLYQDLMNGNIIF